MLAAREPKDTKFLTDPDNISVEILVFSPVALISNIGLRRAEAITGEKTKISTLMLSGSGKNVLFFGSLSVCVSPKSRGGGFGDILIIFPCRLKARQGKNCNRICRR